MAETQTAPQNIQDIQDTKTKPAQKNNWFKKKVIIPLAGILAASQVSSCSPQKDNTNTIPVDKTPPISSEYTEEYTDYKYQQTNLNGRIEEISSDKKGGETTLAKDEEKFAPEQVFHLDRQKGKATIIGKFDIGTQGKDGVFHSLGIVDYTGVDDRPDFSAGYFLMDPKNTENDLIVIKNIGEGSLQVLYQGNEKAELVSPNELRNRMLFSEESKKTLTIHYVDLMPGSADLSPKGKIISESWKNTESGDEVKPSSPSCYIGNCTVDSYPNSKEIPYTTKSGEYFSVVSFSHPELVTEITADGRGHLVQVSCLSLTGLSDQVSRGFIQNNIVPSIPKSTPVSHN